MSKTFEKLLLKRLRPIIEEKNLIPNHQFRFRNKHSTIDQVHRIASIFEKALEKKRIYSPIFLDVAHGLIKSGFAGWSTNWREISVVHWQIFPSKTQGLLFWIKWNHNWCSTRQRIRASSIPAVYMTDTPTCEEEAGIATFADDMTLLQKVTTFKNQLRKYKSAADNINSWTKISVWRTIHDFHVLRFIFKMIRCV